MAKKRLISAIILCAFAVLFAHSVIPHHHEEEHYSQHEGSHHDDHDDIDDNFLGEAFSHFQHEQGGSITYETASPELQYSKVNFDKNTLSLVQYFIGVIHKPPLKHPESNPIHFTASPYSITSLLRGPPSAVA